MLDINKNRIIDLNNELSDIEAVISFRSTAMTLEQYNNLNKIGTIWNLNKLAGDFWYNDLVTCLDTSIYNMRDILAYFNSKNVDVYDSEEQLQGYIKEQVIELDKQLIERVTKAGGPGSYELAISDLIGYLPLLAEHQMISANTVAVERWGYTSNINIEELKMVLIECDYIRSFINDELGKENIPTSKSFEKDKDVKLDGNNIMRYAWACTEFGLYNEAEYIFSTLVDFSNHVMEFARNSDGPLDVDFIESDLNIISTLGRYQDLSRYRLSVNIGLAKVYTATGNIEKAKVLYREIMELFPGRAPVGISPIHYWIGMNRIIESTLELYLISDEDDKPALRKAVSEMFISMRLSGKPNNFGESVCEPLLVIYMMLKTIYK